MKPNTTTNRDKVYLAARNNATACPGTLFLRLSWIRIIASALKNTNMREEIKS